MNCINRLTKDLGFDCQGRTYGLEKRLLLINRNDIDFTATQKKDDVITRLILKGDSRAYFVDYQKNAHISVSTKPEFSDEEINGHKHSVTLKFYNNTAQDYAQINALVQGASLVAIVEHLDKGEQGEHSFDVLGFDVGLEATEGEGSTNAGAYTLVLNTPNGQKEKKVAYKWLETDYANTKPLFDNKLLRPL